MQHENLPAGGAKALEGGDHLTAAVDVGGHRVGNADTADQQRGQADQRQELAQALQRPGHLRRGIAAVGDGEPRIGQRFLDDRGTMRLGVPPPSGSLKA